MGTKNRRRKRGDATLKEEPRVQVAGKSVALGGGGPHGSAHAPGGFQGTLHGHAAGEDSSWVQLQGVGSRGNSSQATQL